MWTPHGRDCRNVSVKLPFYVCLSSGSLFIFSVGVSSFFSYFWVKYIYFTLFSKPCITYVWFEYNKGTKGSHVDKIRNKGKSVLGRGPIKK